MELEKNMEWLIKWYFDKNHLKGFDLAKKTPHSKSLAYHSGGGYTHLFLHLLDGKVMAIHFMNFDIEVSINSFDTLENYLDKCFNTY
jgi:hypothetical protein